MTDLLKSLLLTLVNILWFALLAQIILSWLVVAGMRNRAVLSLYYPLGQLLEPLMGPLRRVVPRLGTFALTPIIAFIILIIMRRVIERIL